MTEKLQTGYLTMEEVTRRIREVIKKIIQKRVAADTNISPQKENEGINHFRKE